MSNNVLFEIGLEELPARFIDNAEKQLYEKTNHWLDELRISFDTIITFSTPRRLAVLIKGIAAEQTTIQEEVRGPSEKIAKTDQGEWSKAAVGFAKGQGKTTDDIYVKDVKGTSYVFVEKHIEGQPTIGLLPSFKKVIESIQFQQNMRWGEGTFRYARPIRWLVALYNDQVIPFEIANVETDKYTFGHRFLGEKITLESPLGYQDQLRNSFVIVDPKEREQLIRSGARALEEEKGFQIEIEDDLLAEVRNLVEYPTVFHGSYDEKYLNLPTEVLITSMKEHQRYFPVKSTSGKLLPYFVSVRNGNDYKIETVAKGNEKVLSARLSDGQFFYEEDQKKNIDFYQDKLTRVVFQEKLGTTSEKVARVTAITTQLAKLLQLDEQATQQTVRAAEISKFDLMTDMVNEFTELQGIMGEKYATLFGEDKAVAQAIREHYLPNQAKGMLPTSLQGAIVSVADKLDTIVGFISVGLKPSGSQDPYSLRRQATGILRIIQERKWDITLETMLKIAMDQYELETNEDVHAELHEFFKLRASYLLREIGIDQDVIEAVLQNEIGFYSYTVDKAKILATKRNDSNFKMIEESLVRILNIAKDREQAEIDVSLFVTDSEKELFSQYEHVYHSYQEVKKQQKADEALMSLSLLAEPIHAFFEHNMVMAEDEKLRKNRLALVNKLGSLINDFADLTVIQWKQHL